MERVNPRPINLIDNLEHQESILDAIRSGMTPVSAFLAHGYSRNLFAQWAQRLERGATDHGKVVPDESLEKLRAFFEQIPQAVAQMELRHVRIIDDAAGRVNEKTGLVDWQPSKFLLTHGGARFGWFPHQEPQVIDMTHHGSTAPEFRAAKEMTEAELVEGLDDPDWAQALLPRTVKNE